MSVRQRKTKAANENPNSNVQSIGAQSNAEPTKSKSKSPTNETETEDIPTSRRDCIDIALLTFGIVCICLAISIYIALPRTHYPAIYPTTGKSSSSSKSRNLDAQDAINQPKNEPKEVKEKPYVDPVDGLNSLLLTKEQLATYVGGGVGDLRYLAVLGEVYDVSSSDFYAPGGGYDYFLGKDGSRGFSTGEVKGDLEEIYQNMSGAVIHGIVAWAAFYRNHENYTYVGKVVGRYWDEKGHSTPERDRIFKIYAEYQVLIDQEEADKEKYPNCRRKWNSKDGTTYWCEKADKNGGKRLVPRGKFSTMRGEDRCACVELVEAKKEKEKFKVYDGCAADSTRCQIKPADSDNKKTK